MKKGLLFYLFFNSILVVEAQTTSKNNEGLDSMNLTLTKKNVAAEPDSILLFTGRKISRAEMDSIFKKAWNESFGKMTEEDKNLINNTNISIVTEDEKIEDENIVSIGNQMWKAENLNTETVRNVDPFSDSVVNDYFVKKTSTIRFERCIAYSLFACLSVVPPSFPAAFVSFFHFSLKDG
jgi:hypothetical protein